MNSEGGRERERERERERLRLRPCHDPQVQLEKHRTVERERESRFYFALWLNEGHTIIRFQT